MNGFQSISSLEEAIGNSPGRRAGVGAKDIVSAEGAAQSHFKLNNNIMNIDQEISNRRSQARPSRHFAIRYSLIDILRFKKALVKLLKFEIS
jgi:hypothetical protein